MRPLVPGAELAPESSDGGGPVGTGVHLLGHHPGRPDPQWVDAWLTVLFFPLVPIGRWRVVCAAEERVCDSGRTLAVEVRSRERLAVKPSLERVVYAIGVAVATLAPIAFGVRMIGEPWATRLLGSLLGQVPQRLANLGNFGDRLGHVVAAGIPLLGTGLELGVSVGGAALPILLLMRLDETTPRVSLRSMFGRGIEPISGG